MPPSQRFPTPTPSSLPLHDSACSADLVQLLEEQLRALMPSPGPQLHEAMRYSLLGAGKRIRPLLVLTTLMQVGEDPRRGLDVACALEMVHAASLVLDDLPSMDDASLRRGQPTCHRHFGEDTAILAAVALMSRAFGVIAADTGLDSDLRVALLAGLSSAIGTEGLVAGQSMDLKSATEVRSATELEQINQQKTGVLFQLAVEAGGRIAGIPDSRLLALQGFASHLGLAFQAYDDLIDRMASEDDAGKDVCQDAARRTLVSELGVEGAWSVVLAHVCEARLCLEQEWPTGPSPLLVLLDRLFRELPR